MPLINRCNLYKLKTCVVIFGSAILILVFMIELLLHRTTTVVHYPTLEIITRDNASQPASLRHYNWSLVQREKVQKCVIPVLNPFDPEIKPYLLPPHMQKCRLVKYGVVDKGILRLKVKNVVYASGAYVERNGDFAVKMNDAFDLTNNSIRNFHKECWSRCGSSGGPCPGFCGVNGLCCRKNFANCSRSIPGLTDYHRCVYDVSKEKPIDLDLVHKLQKEFIKIHILFNDDRKDHEEYHFSFSNAPSVKKESKKKVEASGLNIVILLFDSVSEAHAARSIQKSYRYLKQHPRTFIMKGHSIVGDGTTSQLCAMLTGVPEKNLYEARRGFPGAKPVDNWPWIFKDMHSLHYKTMYSEQDQGSGTFQYRLHGFKDIPTTHFARPLWLAQQWGPLQKGGFSCPHQFNFDYLTKFLDAYKDDSKFAIVFNSILHNTIDKLENTDDDILHFYETFSRSEHANNTIVFLMGDHGLRTSSFRTTLQGKLEERLPLMSITLPPMFDSYPKQMKHLARNSQLMTSHFDTYSTLQHLLTFPHINSKVTNKYGKSLFTDIAKLNRTCADAGVDQHWCTCLQYETADPSKDPNVLIVAKKVIEHINNLNQKHANKRCEVLSLRKVIRSGRSTPNAEVNQFVATATKGRDCDSCDVKYDKNKKFTRFRYQINLSVSPSGGEYEADSDVSIDSRGGVNVKLDAQISRTNLYGNQPACIASAYPHLRPFCMCTTPKPT